MSSAPSKGTYDNVTGVWAVGDMAANATETLIVSVTVEMNRAIIQMWLRSRSPRWILPVSIQCLIQTPHRVTAIQMRMILASQVSR